MDKASQLEKLRKNIDTIDKKLVLSLAERFKITKKIIFLKKKSGLPARDVKREDTILKEAKKLAERLEMRPEFIADVFKKILKETKKQ